MSIPTFDFAATTETLLLEPYLLGDIGGLRNVSGNATQAAQSFIFRNETSGAASVFKQSSRGWFLLGGGHTATYSLHQDVPSGWVNGFMICEMYVLHASCFNGFLAHNTSGTTDNTSRLSTTSTLVSSQLMVTIANLLPSK